MTHRVEHLAKGVMLYPGDCLDVLKGFEAQSIDACVCDPPYHLTSIVKRFGSETAAPVKSNGVYARSSRGFMGKAWDGGDIAFRPDVWREVLRVLKPGAYIVAFSSSRTYHRMACAIEDVGFITHPLIGWITGQGFPKAHNVSKTIDKMAGAEREVIGRRPDWVVSAAWREAEGRADRLPDASLNITVPATDLARQWDGWYYGTQSLKPAIEPIYVGQKPFERGLNGTQNILKWGTGAFNIDACRVEHVTVNGGNLADNPHLRESIKAGRAENLSSFDLSDHTITPHAKGRWPANCIHDGSDEVVGAFPYSAGQNGSVSGDEPSSLIGDVYGARERIAFGKRGDYSGSAARFYYSSKADFDDRLGSRHPSVKPIDLIQYLCRLVCRKGGLCLDPFAGTGTTGEACLREGMRAILIEREEEYQEDIRRRMKLAVSGHDERAREAIKARDKGKPVDAGPLFNRDWSAA